MNVNHVSKFWKSTAFARDTVSHRYPTYFASLHNTSCSRSPIKTSGMYKFILKYGDRNLVHQYFVTVTYKPEIVSFQQLPEFVSVSFMKIKFLLDLYIEYGISGEGSQISTNQKLESTAF